MPITDHHLRTVAFICREIETEPGIIEIRPGGTAFFVIVEEEKGIANGYAVTAAHCIEQQTDRPIYLRINVDDTFEDIETRFEDWYVHSSADVALAPFVATRPGGYNINGVDLPQFINANYEYKPPMRGFTHVGPEAVKPTDPMKVGPGQEIFFVGLFAQSYGSTKNLPVVRDGTIARMPLEPLWLRRADGTEYQQLAYLVECRSWGGFSGSPVYWRHPIAAMLLVDAPVEYKVATGVGKMLIPAPEAEVVGFLGLVSGHYDTSEAETGDSGVVTISQINSGIAVVTPAEAVRELLMREDVVNDRKKRAEDAKKKRGAVVKPDSLDERTFTREQFTRDLQKATRRLDDGSDQEQS